MKQNTNLVNVKVSTTFFLTSVDGFCNLSRISEINTSGLKKKITNRKKEKCNHTRNQGKA